MKMLQASGKCTNRGISNAVELEESVTICDWRNQESFPEKHYG